LEQALLDSLEDIRVTLYSSATFIIDPPRLMSYRDFNLEGVLYPDTSRVKEFEPALYHINFGRRSRGDYYPTSGRIFLKEGNWCRTCLIHETLHSVSIFAANVSLGFRYLFFREGITEFLNGYVLWKQYPICYKSWKEGRYPSWCAMSYSYRTMAKIWYTFCRFVDFDIVKRLFFGNGEHNWGRVWGRFLDEIHNAGYNFRDPLRGNIGRLQDRFLDQCKRSFGRSEVEQIMENESDYFDYEALQYNDS